MRWTLRRTLARLSAAVGVALALAGQATAPAHASSPLGEMELVDLTPLFATAWAETEALPEADRAGAFQARFADVLPGFYSHERMRGTTAERYRAHLTRALAAYPARRAEIAEVSRNFETMFRSAIPPFEAEFGPMRGYPPVYLVNSIGEFDGGTREIGGRTILMFGADMIMRYHPGDDLQPFFHHELFHLRHARTFKECAQVWCSLWTEGLAVYVAARLNPTATDSELLLVQPEPIRAAVERDRKAAVCAVVARLDSASDDDMQALFSFKRLSPGTPPRFGYYVGYLAAAEAGRTRSLKALAAMDNAQVRPLLERSLRRLAGGAC